MTDEGNQPPADLLGRLRPRIEALFRAHGVAPEEADTILHEAADEVRQRAPHPRELERRLLHAIETRCRRHSEELQRQVRAALDRAREAQEDEP